MEIRKNRNLKQIEQSERARERKARRRRKEDGALTVCVCVCVCVCDVAAAVCLKCISANSSAIRGEERHSTDGLPWRVGGERQKARCGRSNKRGSHLPGHLW